MTEGRTPSVQFPGQPMSFIIVVALENNRLFLNVYFQLGQVASFLSSLVLFYGDDNIDASVRIAQIFNERMAQKRPLWKKQDSVLGPWGEQHHPLLH